MNGNSDINILLKNNIDVDLTVSIITLEFIKNIIRNIDINMFFFIRKFILFVVF